MNEIPLHQKRVEERTKTQIYYRGNNARNCVALTRLYSTFIYYNEDTMMCMDNTVNLRIAIYSMDYIYMPINDNDNVIQVFEQSAFEIMWIFFINVIFMKNNLSCLEHSMAPVLSVSPIVQSCIVR